MAKAHHKMAQSYMATKDYTSALNEMLQALKLKPNSAEFHSSIAVIYFEKKAYLKSEEHYKKSLRLAPNDPIVENNLAALYLNMQRWDAAAVLFRKVADNLLFRYKTRALIGLGVAQTRGGHPMKAVLTYNEVLEMFPDNQQALFNLGKLYYDMDKYELAKSQFAKIIALDDSNNNVRMLVGQCYMQLCELDKAADMFREVANREDHSELGDKAREYLDTVTK
ncbi:MAG: hypothetical protein B6I36_11150 [Desulfobacteraceae bacterium 4572_35.1]|nr:MAG: hypothetical protein B6I36_11150 [Desulfobacteraceae bacterium 4572_35.1]